MKLRYALALSLPLLLSGCFTTMALEKSHQGIRVNKGEMLDTDHLRSFGVLKSTNQPVFVGDKYWLVADNRTAKEVRQLMEFQAKHSERLSVWLYAIEMDKQRETGKVEAQVFYNHADTPQEIKDLEGLFFLQYPRSETRYQRDYRWKFKVYKKTDQTPVMENQFHNPIEVRFQATDYKLGGGATQLLLPLALVGDLVTAPFQIFIMNSF